MPTIEVNKNDLLKLINKKMNQKELEMALQSAKAEIEDEVDGKYKIELKDTNRPDLWTCAGIARQINQYLGLKTHNYSFFNKKTELFINVNKNIEKIRPYIAGFAVKNIKISEDLLIELIQNQEKITENYGRKRKDVAIGIYKFEKIKFPVIYKAIKPENIKFIPLGEDNEMDLKEILKKHPKGIEFGHIVKDYKEYPIIIDSNNNVLSFPPIINSRFIGEVEQGDKEIFIELTGWNLTNILLVANIFACDLADRGAEIIPVQINYPYETKYSKQFPVPYDFDKSISGHINEFTRLIGYIPDEKDINTNLSKMQYFCIKVENDKLNTAIPPYRNDVMHLVDVIEDYAIGKGYDNFKVELPSEHTIGALSEDEIFSDKVRNWVIGMGFQEIISNILTSKENIYNKMNVVDRNAAEIMNPMAESFNILRNSIIPSLLEVEAYSAKADYPHRIFEIGEAAVLDQQENHGYKTIINLGMLCSHPKTNFSEMRSFVDNIMYYTGIDKFELKSIEKSFLLKGRSAEIIYQSKSLGYFGEIHPEILEKWDINMPCSVIEIYLDKLLNNKN